MSFQYIVHVLYGYMFIVYIKRDIYKDIAEDIEIKFNTSNYELDRPFPKGKNENVIRLMKDKLRGKIMAKFVWLRAKTYLAGDGSEDRKEKRHKKLCHKDLNLKTA